MNFMPRRRVSSSSSSSSAFTLIELLVVIAIIAILAVVVVLTLNPAQLLAQSRDANRVSDMATLESAIALYQTDQGGASLGIASTSYLSVPDTSSACANLGMPVATGYSYACAAPTSSRVTNGQGWIPLNFQNLSMGTPFGSLPVDSVNQTSSNLYYTYQANNGQYEATAFMESQKYAKTMATTGGNDPALYEVGSGVTTLPNIGRGLVGYWPMDEGTGSSTQDLSGGGSIGTWAGTASGSNGYYSAGKVGPWAGTFDGTSTLVLLASSTPLTSPFSNGITMFAWVYPLNSTNQAVFTAQSAVGRQYGFDLYGGVNEMYLIIGANTSPGTIALSSPWVIGAWNCIVVTANGATANVYLNGHQVYSAAYTTLPSGTGSLWKIVIGENGTGNSLYMDGFIDDVRIYNRALSAAEIQELYNAEK